MPSTRARKVTATAKKQVKQTKPATTVAQAPAAAVAPQDVQEQIRRRAYELYQQRNGEDGSPEEDWLRAEAEILTRSA